MAGYRVDEGVPDHLLQVPPPVLARRSCNPRTHAQHEPLQEVKLFSNTAERDSYDNQATVYALLQTIEWLERAYNKGAIQPRESVSRDAIMYLPTLLTRAQTFPPLIYSFTGPMNRYEQECERLIAQYKVCPFGSYFQTHDAEPRPLLLLTLLIQPRFHSRPYSWFQT